MMRCNLDGCCCGGHGRGQEWAEAMDYQAYLERMEKIIGSIPKNSFYNEPYHKECIDAYKRPQEAQVSVMPKRELTLDDVFKKLESIEEKLGKLTMEIK